MRKSVIAVLAASVLGVAGYLTPGTAVQAEEVTLYKNPQCGCCEGYADYLRENGFDVCRASTFLAGTDNQVGRYLSLR